MVKASALQSIITSFLLLAGCGRPLAIPTEHRISADACLPGALVPGAVDDCHRDADCPANTLCSCGDRTADSREANRCVPSNCRTDGDCGDGQYCAPSHDPVCGNLSDVTRYACTTPDDACRTQSNCSHDGGNGAYCAYMAELGHWACSNSNGVANCVD